MTTVSSTNHSTPSANSASSPYLRRPYLDTRWSTVRRDSQMFSHPPSATGGSGPSIGCSTVAPALERALPGLVFTHRRPSRSGSGLDFCPAVTAADSMPDRPHAKPVMPISPPTQSAKWTCPGTKGPLLNGSGAFERTVGPVSPPSSENGEIDELEDAISLPPSALASTRPCTPSAKEPEPHSETTSVPRCCHVLNPSRARQLPKSDYALWVGNIPSHPTLREIIDLFASPDILSVYLIHRTGCAFVNYRTQASLEAAVEAFNECGGRIRDHKLVVKVQEPARRNSASVDGGSDEEATVPSTQGSPNRYFICKSLAPQELDAARESGQWSTQAQNIQRFNSAFRTSENVYLIFSANRTSAFYGFARMQTPIPEQLLPPPSPPADAAEEINIEATAARYSEAGELLCPAGQIVEDKVRRCNFWEVLDCPREEPEPEYLTAPCKIQWVSSGSPLSFAHTKHLRNPLNSNKLVKIARDGTEIEPSVGSQLCDLFE